MKKGYFYDCLQCFGHMNNLTIRYKLDLLLKAIFINGIEPKLGVTRPPLE